MNRLCVWAVLFSFTLVGGAGIRLELALERDTLLPYEPVLARTTIVNETGDSVVIPKVFSGSMPNSFVYDYSSATGTKVGGPLWSYVDCWAGPPKCTLASGRSVSVSGLISSFAGESDPDSKGGVCFLPGRYSLRAYWRVATNATIAGSPVFADTSNVVSFIVRQPDDSERAALSLWRDADYYQWHYLSPLGSYGEKQRDRWDRIAAVCREIISNTPAEPYVVLAEDLMLGYYFDRFPGGLNDPACRDSVSALCSLLLEGHPRSPLAVDFLRRNAPEGYLQMAKGKEANVEFLRRLASEFPEIPVGKEAARQLRAIDAGRDPSSNGE